MAIKESGVIDGEFKGMNVYCVFDKVFIEMKRRPVIGPMRRLYLDQLTVANYQLISYTSDISTTPIVVLITFRNGKQSLIKINSIAFEFLKKNCMYNVRLNGNAYDSSFDEHREIKCPHCKNIAYGAVGEKCVYCKRPFSMPAKELKIRDRLIVVMLAVFYPIGVVLLWQNDSYYKDTKIKLTIIFGILFISMLCVMRYSRNSVI